LAHVLWDQGFPDKALHHAEDAIAAARAAAHPLSEAWAIAFLTNIRQLRGEVGPCLERAAATLALATEQVLPYYVARALVFSGWALVKDGKGAEGLARLRAGLDSYRAVGSRIWRSQSLALFADACLATGRIEEGLSAVREALSEVEETDTRFYESELNRLEGELLLASEDPDESRGEASFRKAIAIARGQQAKSWELRAATSLTRLLARQHKHDEARALLAPIYGWFTEGFGTADLKEAKGLLNELR
jgi:predicted ATPase